MSTIKGFHVWPDDDAMLLELIIVDKEWRGNWNSPTEVEVAKALLEAKLPVDELIQMIRGMGNQYHTVLIDVPKYMEGRKEDGAIYFFEPEPIDYKELLKKYIDHVGLYEGSTFLMDHARSSYPDMPKFTDEEWAELKNLDKE